MQYIIVKHGGSSWNHYFMEDPKEGTVHPSYSTHDSHTGMDLAIKPSYEDFDEAQQDCERMNKENPVGDYAVCKLMES